MSRNQVLKQGRHEEVAPCGVFCGACPSFQKSCWGCASERMDQRRKSKWACPIRACCYGEQGLDSCGTCEEFPCKKINKKLIHSHEGDPRFQYRHEVFSNLRQLQKVGINKFLEIKREAYSCPECHGRVLFYSYCCSQCGKQVS